MQEVTTEPDIMGEFRPEVEMFYRRDEVVVAEERNFVLETFFSDLVFSRDMRVTCVRYVYSNNWVALTQIWDAAPSCLGSRYLK